MPNFVYLNNKYVNFKDAKIHIEDRGFQFSDSVYEVIKVLNHKSFEKDHLLLRALERRHDSWGDIVTYSRKVFVPLTNMCRDTCSYCTFVKDPSSKFARILDPESVMEIVLLGERSGCKEVLLSLGEKPELRYEKAREELGKLGFSTMIEYLKFICDKAYNKIII